eukprot:6065790-Pleurochrysis_carterae.AAC.1
MPRRPQSEALQRATKACKLNRGKKAFAAVRIIKSGHCPCSFAVQVHGILHPTVHLLTYQLLICVQQQHQPH